MIQDRIRCGKVCAKILAAQNRRIYGCYQTPAHLEAAGAGDRFTANAACQAPEHATQIAAPHWTSSRQTRLGSELPPTAPPPTAQSDLHVSLILTTLVSKKSTTMLARIVEMSVVLKSSEDQCSNVCLKEMTSYKRCSLDSIVCLSRQCGIWSAILLRTCKRNA